MRNIEIKATVKNKDDFLNKVKPIANHEAVLRQVDWFFNSLKGRNGRLKLRVENEEKFGNLIYYERPDQTGPKLSSYSMYKTSDPKSLIECLTASNGMIGKVHKTRTLYMYGQTRIHFDEVEGLGTFMELEVVLNPSQTVQQGQEIADDIMLKLGIQHDDLLEGAYFDLLYK